LPTLPLARQWAAAITICATLLSGGQPTAAAELARIETIVVLYPENRSFDHLYGLFPGANGIANASPEQTAQRDHDGQVLPFLRVWDSQGKPDPRFPELPNAPFRIDAPPVSLSAGQVLLSPIHAYYHSIEQINGGRNDMFAAMSTVGGYTMGYFDGSPMKLWQWAKAFTLADNFFMGAFGGSYLNHQYLICACTPVFKDAPPSMRARLDAQGKLEKKPDSPSARDGAVQTYTGGLGGQITPDGFSVNTTQPLYQPSGIPPAEGAHWKGRTPRAANALGFPCRRKRTGPSATRYRPRASAGRGMRAAGKQPLPMARARPTRNEA
jgi:acid phosphatase